MIATVRDGGIFLDKWIAHYGAAFGEENLYVTLDGEDQVPPEGTAVNYTTVPHVPRPMIPGEKRRAAFLTNIAKGLYDRSYDVVISTDIDEYIIVDPQVGMSLAEYLSASSQKDSLSGLGLDVIQHLDEEQDIDPGRPFLDQRRYAQVASRYTKPCITFRPLRWGSGMHRIKGHNFRIDPNLYIIHTGMIDARIAKVIGSDADRHAQGWGKHQLRREKVFRTVRSAPAIEGDVFFPVARHHMALWRPFWALNKPGHPNGDAIVRLPERFRGVL